MAASSRRTEGGEDEEVHGGVRRPFLLCCVLRVEMSGVSWQRRLEEEEVLEEVLRRSQWKVAAHGWEEERFTVESILV